MDPREFLCPWCLQQPYGGPGGGRIGCDHCLGRVDRPCPRCCCAGCVRGRAELREYAAAVRDAGLVHVGLQDRGG